MPALPLNVLPIEGEAAFSLASRLAVVNMVAMSEFLADMGMSFAGLVHGAPPDIHRLADLAGVDATDLSQANPRRAGDGTWSMAGQRLSEGSLRSSAVRGCAHCLHEDRLRGGAGPGGVRSHWLIGEIEYCWQHQVPLLVLWQAADRRYRFDVAQRLVEIDLADFPHVAARDLPPFELWLRDRFRGISQPESWLDDLSIAAVSDLCRAIGALNSAPADDLRSNGLAVCRAGVAAIADRLTLAARRTSPERALRDLLGPLSAVFGRYPQEVALAELREGLRAEVLARWPLAPGSDLFDAPVLERRLHSVASLARWTGSTPAEVGAMVRGTGGSHRIADEWAAVAASDAVNIIQNHSRPVSIADFRSRLGLSTPLFNDLQGMGLLPADQDGRMDLSAGWALLEHLWVGAEAIGRAGGGWCDLDNAAAKTFSTPAAIIRRILAGGPIRIGHHTRLQKSTGRVGFAALMVDLDLLSDRPVSAEVFGFAEGISPAEMLRFFRAGHAPAEITARPRGRKDVVMLTAAQRAVFHRDFVSRKRLAIQWRGCGEEIQARLDRLGAVPVSGFTQIYQRGDLRS